jgi:hypothetical protein
MFCNEKNMRIENGVRMKEGRKAERSQIIGKAHDIIITFHTFCWVNGKLSSLSNIASK